MAQTKEGALKLSANYFGMTVSEYLIKIQDFNWCNKCKSWKCKKVFCMDRSRLTGLHKNCNDCRWVNGGKKKNQFKSGEISHFKGRNHSDTSKEVMRLNNKGEGNPNWKGGITNLIISIRNMAEFKLWRLNVYHAGKFTCAHCGVKKIGNNIILDADHIYPLSKILFNNNVKSTDEALLIEKLWDVSNGRCLCRECHKKTDTWGVNLN